MVLAADAAAARRTPGPGPQDSETSGFTPGQEARMRAALVVPREPLDVKQRKIKRGTTGFMLAMHVAAV
ncbi:MAG: acyl-CoA desaturase, partial [Synechococcus sp. ELA619]